MITYRYHVEAFTKSLTFRSHEQTYFSYFCHANEITDTIKQVLTEIKNEMYYDTKITTFKITRIAETKYFHLGEKVVFEWHCEGWPYV